MYFDISSFFGGRRAERAPGAACPYCGAALRTALIGAGFAILSIDYRLAPETKLPEIFNDVRDAFRWAREDAPKHAAIALRA